MSKDKQYKLGANAVVVIHVAWTVLIFAGAIFVLFNPWYSPFQIGVIGFTLLLALPFGMVCPLTKLEERLRKKVDPSYTNHGSYLMTYMNKIFGTRFTKSSLAISVAVLYIISIAISILFIVYK